MGYCYKYLHSIVSALILTGLPLVALCQTDTLSGKTALRPSLYAGIGYGSNMIYLGSTISGNLPYFSSSLTVGAQNSLFVSASASHVSNTNPYVAFYGLSASYRNTVNTWFDYSADLAYYKVPESLSGTLFNDFVMINLTTGFDWKLIYTKLTLSGLLSDANSGYIQVRNSRYFQTKQFFKGKVFLSFDPNINLLFGRLVKIESTTGTSKFGNAPPFVQFKKKQTGTTFTYSYVFGMMDTEFSFPVTFNFTNFSFEAEPIYILPAYSNDDYPAPKGFSLNISVYFRIL